MKCLALLVASVLFWQAQAAPLHTSRVAQACRAGAGQPVRDARMLAAIALAREEHRLFGGQSIDRTGAIASVGFHEAEFDRLPSETTPTWMRVARFWAVLGEDQPPTLRASGERLISRKLMLDRLAGLRGAGGLAPLDESELGAVQSALLRSALVDHPWSAAFISYLMKQSGFARDEFEFSDSHVDYVNQAFLASAAEAGGTPAESAFRACDPGTTPPRAGDLICHTREGSAAIASYAALAAELQARRLDARPREIPMHCDLVVSADEGGNAKIETVGGNVFQSVTLRQMTLNDRKTLSARYFQRAQAAGCATDASCVRNLSRRPWVVLLQFRN